MGLLRVIAITVLILGCHNTTKSDIEGISHFEVNDNSRLDCYRITKEEATHGKELHNSNFVTAASTAVVTTLSSQVSSDIASNTAATVNDPQTTATVATSDDATTTAEVTIPAEITSPVQSSSTEDSGELTTQNVATELSTDGEVPSTSTALPEVVTSEGIVSSSSLPVDETTTATTAVDCPPGTFGHNCEFECQCLNASEACDSQTGHCSSGCPPEAFGPGCLISTTNGAVAIVVVLACMLAIALLLIVVLVYYIAVYLPTKMRKKELHKRAQAETYDFHEMAKRKSLVPAIELRKSVPRISELDIQVMADHLGQGRFGDVMRGYHRQKDTNVEVAFKTLKAGSTEEDIEEFVCQLEIYSSIEAHPNVLHFYGVCAVGDQMYAAFEYVPHGNLRNFLRSIAIQETQDGSQEGSHPDLQQLTPRGKLLKFAYDIALGMRHLARQRIIHRELSAKSVLVGHNYVCKIAGLNPPGHTRASRWMSPESLTKGEFSVQSDVWSFGIVMWEIMSFGGKPFAEYATKDLPLAMVDEGVRPPKPDGCDGDIYGLMKWCWSDNPDDRPTFLILSNTMREMIDSGQMRQDLDDSDID